LDSDASARVPVADSEMVDGFQIGLVIIVRHRRAVLRVGYLTRRERRTISVSA